MSGYSSGRNTKMAENALKGFLTVLFQPEKEKQKTAEAVENTAFPAVLSVGRDDRIRTCGLCVPNATLYQTEPHPVTQDLYYHIFVDLSTRFCLLAVLSACGFVSCSHMSSGLDSGRQIRKNILHRFNLAGWQKSQNPQILSTAQDQRAACSPVCHGTPLPPVSHLFRTFHNASASSFISRFVLYGSTLTRTAPVCHVPMVL